VSLDTSAASLSAWVSANYANGDEKQEGDIIVLTAVSGRAETWIHNGGVAGTVTRGSSYSNETNSANTGISIQSTGASGTNANLPPYYALCYIMKA